jgi:hypothetical protein
LASEVIGWMGNDVIRTPTDDSNRDDEKRNIQYKPRFNSACHQTAIGHNETDDHPQKNRHGVGVNGQIEGCPICSDATEPFSDSERLPFGWGRGNTGEVHTNPFNTLKTIR